MIAQLRIGKGEQRRRKEHSLVIGVRYQQTDSLVAQLGESRARHGNGVEPQHYG